MTYALTQLLCPRGTLLGNEAVHCVFAVSWPEFGDLKEKGKTNLLSSTGDREPVFGVV